MVQPSNRRLVTEYDFDNITAEIVSGDLVLTIGSRVINVGPVGSGSGSIESTDITDATATGVALLTASSSTSARSVVGAAPTSHTHTAAQISNSTSVGRSVLTAADAAAARTVLGVSESGGTLTSADITDSTTLGRSILTAGSAPAVRDLIDAASRGHVHALDDLSDVDVAGATTGQVLTLGSSGWEAATPASGGGGGYEPPVGGIPRSDLATDVTGSLDAADTAVQPAALAPITTAVSTAQSTADDAYDLAETALQPGDLPAIPSALGDLSDVDTTGATTGQVLTKTATGSEFQDAPSGGGGGVSLVTDETTPVPGGTPAGLIVRLSE